MKQVFYFVIFTIFPERSESLAVHMKLPDVNVTELNVTSHLEFSHIQKICMERDTICKANITKVCALRRINGTFEYKDFENSCYLFLSNMCDYPGVEFAIVEGTNCNTHLKSRRHYVTSGIDPGTESGSTTNDTTGDGNTTKGILRGFSFSPLYDVDTSYDGHICPHSCHDVYMPVCVNANRGFGKYLKFYQFVNHCESDKYYCGHWEEFSPPPDREQESVDASQLGWSYCGASRYLQFSMLAQTTSSMGHYGWLEGDYRYSKILEPHQRKPGYG